MAEEKKTVYTPEQQAAIDCPGNVIVSASAGSGKTTVMIERLMKAILSGASLDQILCVTFTKKAAANMKEKLRKKLISALGEATDEKVKAHLKEQLAAIPAADISTIHSFCSQLIRRYFYILGCDGSFEIVSSDDSLFKEYIDRAFENLFDRLYEANDPDFMLLLQFLRRKRKDDNVKSVILSTYFAARAVSHYRDKINASLSIYNPEGFDGICEKLQAACRERYQALEDVLYSFHTSFIPKLHGMSGSRIATYSAIFEDMYRTFELAKQVSIFDELPPTLTGLTKPRDTKKTPFEVKEAGEEFKAKKDELNRKYKAVRADIADRDTEYTRFMKSGELAKAFANILLQFDDEFSAVKRDENKLDYNDLEHYSLELLSNDEVMAEIRAKYRYVFVDEYQDVNPVQEEIISSIGGQIFLVGDVKQAIYGFRGSKSKFFSDKFDHFETLGGTALRIPTNFRSADGIIQAVNDMFSASMTPSVCGFSYKSPARLEKEAEEPSETPYSKAAEEFGPGAARAMFGAAGTAAPAVFHEEGNPAGNPDELISYRPAGAPPADLSAPILSSAATKYDITQVRARPTVARYISSLTSSSAPADDQRMMPYIVPVEPLEPARGRKGKKKEEKTDGPDEETEGAFAMAEDMAAWASRFISRQDAAEMGHEMKACDGWPEGSAKVTMHIFGEEQKEEIERKVYSVKEDAKAHKETLESAAIVKLIRSIYGRPRYDKDTKSEVPTQYGDICILARKNRSLESIVAALTAARIPVSGAQKGNICDTPEVRQMLDILSVIDNSEQDIALITALLSPLGKFTENELAVIKTAVPGRTDSFRTCCKRYRDTAGTPLAAKLTRFYNKLDELQEAAGVLSAGTLITRILSETGLEAEYSANGGDQLRNVLRLMQEGPELTLAGFLRKIRQGGYSINSPACAPSDCVQVMTMHASKGLEFPVVIIADICRQFTGNGAEDIYFDETYGFAPRCYNPADRTYSDTILRKHLRGSIMREDIKNELNLFYVACTRAMTELDIMSATLPPAYNTAAALTARNYASLIDFDYPSIRLDDMRPDAVPSGPEGTGATGTVPAGEEGSSQPGTEAGTQTAAGTDTATDTTIDTTAIEDEEMPPEELMEPLDFNKFFEAEYIYESCINLPVKTSASEILRSYKDSEEESGAKGLFTREEEEDEAEVRRSDPTGADRGTAYHRFLELCNFSVKTPDGIQEEILSFVASEAMPAEQAAYLNPYELAKILSEPVFQGLETAQTLREQEFLCRMPARKFMDTDATDSVLVQGAIDLLICRDGSYSIVDYKYSGKDKARLLATYAPQLRLYRTAVSLITGVPEDQIPATIVNIHRMYTVPVPVDA